LRARHLDSMPELPAWLDRPASTLLGRALLSYGSHADGVYAGSMAFFGTLSLFPLVLLLITLFGTIVQSADATQLVISRVAAFIPGSDQLVSGVIGGVTGSAPIALGIGVAGLLWSSMGVFMTMGYSLNRTWNVPHDRNIVVQYVISALLALSVGLVVVASLIMSALANLLYFVAGPLLDTSIPGIGSIAVLGSNLVDFAIVCAAAAFLYRALPNLYVEWRDVMIPAAFVAVIGGAAKFGFTWYLGAIAHVGRIYGPIAAVAGLMLWLFVASVLLLFGAELSHQLAIRRFADGNRPPVT
jgi:membrane protein